MIYNGSKMLIVYQVNSTKTA